MSDAGSPASSAGARRVQQRLEALGIDARVIELAESTRSAEEAARAVGCDVAQIAKSLVFKGARTGEPVLVIASGANLVDVGKVAKVLGESVSKADADFVVSRTGYVIGGVPPVAHREQLRTLIDEDLSRHEQVWAAAGTPRAVFSLDPRELERITGGRRTDLKR